MKNIIEVNDKIRLKKYEGKHDFALAWYQDVDTVENVCGVRTPFTKQELDKMYEIQNKTGELYFIEIKEKNMFTPIGDVCLSKDDLAIVIGDKNYRGKGIGKTILLKLIQLAKGLGYKRINVSEIYKFNTASIKLFESVGFIKCGETQMSFSYILNL